ncbi:DUF2511 domain-containing protein [Photorhabdus temperata subsp. temperata]
MKIKKFTLSCLLLTLSSVAFAVPFKGITKDEYGDEWAFNSNEAQLQCIYGGAFIMDLDTNRVYAMTGLANALARKGKYPAEDINNSDYWKDNPHMPGAKINLMPFIDAALELCNK